MQRTKVLLVFGGESAEHEVSVSSARNVFAALDDTKFDVELVFIDKKGHWWLVDSVEDYQSTAGMTQLVPVLGSGTFITIPETKSLQPEVIFPVLHGPNGEDGSLQGVAQMMHIPIVGCGVVGSAVCMDKEVSKRLARQSGIPVADYVVFRRGDPAPDFSHLTLELGNPLFVKPANMGSSVGVSRVTNRDEFQAALAEALKFDHKVLVEQAVKGREVECAVLGNDDPQASGVGEVVANAEFYSYDAKYSDVSEAKIAIPAEIGEESAQKVRELSVEAFRVLECRGLARADFFLTDSGEVILNEINTLPGFTNISMYPKLWRESGMGYPQLVEKLVNLALETQDVQ